MQQTDKNTVNAKNQLETSQYVSFWGEANAKVKVLFVGNSITRHGVAAEIGWNNDFGMAASKMENDYVHILAEQILDIVPASFCICQVSVWEQDYKNGTDYFHLFQDAREFKADVIIMRTIENSSKEGFDGKAFSEQYKALLDFLNKQSSSNIILTSSFWRHVGDPEVEKLSQERKLPYVQINDLGEKDEMKAIGKYEHSGIANHPGDEGMRLIAERIWNVLKEMIETY